MWSPHSWQSCPVQQAVEYKDPAGFDKVLIKLSKQPPLVTVNEIEQLNQLLVEVAEGKRFLLQGGDCAESFAECSEQNISDKFKVILQMSLILLHGCQKPVLRVGRVAGQYAKPRSNTSETQNRLTLPCYRGDLINNAMFCRHGRQADPNRMLEGYHYAAATLNYIRAMMHDGCTHLQNINDWALPTSLKTSSRHQKVISEIDDSLKFMTAFNGLNHAAINNIDHFFSSHEALHLPYETALTRLVNDKWYNLSTHFPWLGIRTANLNSAHIEYIRGIENPVAIKIGPEATPKYIQELVNKLNPNNQIAKLMLITRLGADQVKNNLPDLIKAVQDTNLSVIWSCDPMHGNTKTTSLGLKTRYMDDILKELELAISIHKQHNNYLGGIHLELTGEHVTECIGGQSLLTEQDLSKAFKSLVDPRLNYEQAIELSLELSQWI